MAPGLIDIMVLFSFLAALVNLTWSPDSSRVAYTLNNDLYVVNVAAKDTVRLTDDGSDTILNGYASWVYYEEILGRQSKYRAFWWSPDSKKLAYYRFDDGAVPMFPIFSPFGQGGVLRQTRYPKAGQDNPIVQVRIANLETGQSVTAFSGDKDTYFGTPFWGADSKELFVSAMPRRQNRLTLYAVDESAGSSRMVYKESYRTWVDWIEGMLFTDKGLYMARSFESGWQQIYFLSFDGKELKKLTDGNNWDIELLKVNQKKNTLWFMAKRDSKVHPTLYSLNLKSGRINALTSPEFWTKDVAIADDCSFKAQCSTAAIPWFTVDSKTRAKDLPAIESESCEVASRKYPNPQLICINNDGFDLYGLINYPAGFDPSRKYPVLMEVYGGPGTAYVRDRWGDRDASNRWCYDNGVIYMVVDPRSSGENGRRGMDEAFQRMTVVELQDYIAWAEYMQSLPYVDAGHIGVDGFSFGGTTTAMLVLRYPELFHCGIAGGGVYDWSLYDTHYTERFMCTPLENPDGYREASVLHYVDNSLFSKSYEPYHLKITHGTGDDNVHFQNSLQLIDALQKKGLLFDFMIYPDGMHGYRGDQHLHDAADAAFFWKTYLFD